MIPDQKPFIQDEYTTPEDLETMEYMENLWRKNREKELDE